MSGLTNSVWQMLNLFMRMRLKNSSFPLSTIRMPRMKYPCGKKGVMISQNKVQTEPRHGLFHFDLYYLTLHF